MKTHSPYADPRNTTPEDWNTFSSNLPAHWKHTHHASIPTTMGAIDVASLQEGIVQLVTADQQTAGRGQRGTHWESDTAQNLTFSFALRPIGVKASKQFILSQIVALAMVRTLEAYMDEIAIKWPNDIYFRHQKIAGILIEHSLRGEWIDTTLIGIGLNVNQEIFHSDAPNPISLRQILGRPMLRTHILATFVRHFETLYQQLQNGDTVSLEIAYRQTLYRREGWHLYEDTATGNRFSAALIDVASSGLLTLRTAEGEFRTYAFKEIKFILP